MSASPSKRRTTRVTNRRRPGGSTAERVGTAPALAETAGILASGRPLKAAFSACLRSAVNSLEADRGAAMLLDDDGALLRPIAAAGLDPESIEPLRSAPEGDLTAWAQAAAPVLGTNPESAQLTVPLVFRNAAVGLVAVARDAAGTDGDGVKTARDGARARFDEAEQAFAEALASQMALAAQAALPREDIMARERLERALQFAHTLQGAFTPRELPAVGGGLRLAARRTPSIEMAGDFYDVAPLAQGFAVATGETSGRGETAGIHIAQTVCMLRGALARTNRPGAALKHFARELATPMQRAFLANLALVTMDPADRRFAYAGAGAARLALHAPGADATEMLLDGSATPMGMLPDATFPEHEGALPEGGTLLLYTEGLARHLEETAGRGADAFLAECLEAARGEGAPSAEMIFRRLCDGAEGELPCEDMTLFSIDHRPDA